MQTTDRRGFLGCSLGAAALATLEGGARWARATPGPSASPPSRRFLDAIVAGDIQGVRRALELDPGLVHVRDAAGRSGFALSRLEGHLEISALIVEAGHVPDLHESALALDWERFEDLASATPGLLNRDHPIGGTAMHAAALGGAGTQIWRVYRYGGDPNVSPRGENGMTALRAALEHPDLATAELTAASLLGNGADPNGEERDGDTALHAASSRGSAEIVEMLIRKGASVDATDRQGRTPLERAEAARARSVVSILQRHADIARDHSTSRTRYDVNGYPYRAPDLSAFDPIERGRVVGVAHGNFDALREAVGRHPLLAHARATTTEAAVEASAHMGRQEMVDYLLEGGAPYALPTSVVRNDLVRSRQLLDEDPLRVHERGPHDFALLWYPIIGGDHLAMAELLLERGAEIERQHWLGTTALHYAALGGSADMAALLIEKGADVNRRGRKFDPAGQTPLEIATARENEAVAALLRDHGAKG